MRPLLGSYKYRIHNLELNYDSLVNMHILFFVQVVFPYLKKNQKIKNQKEGKSPKRKIKGLRKNDIPQKKKDE